MWSLVIIVALICIGPGTTHHHHHHDSEGHHHRLHHHLMKSLHSLVDTISSSAGTTMTSTEASTEDNNAEMEGDGRNLNSGYGPSIISLTKYNEEVKGPTLFNPETGRSINLEDYPNFSITLPLAPNSPTATSGEILVARKVSGPGEFIVEAPKGFGIMAVIKSVNLRTTATGCNDFILFGDVESGIETTGTCGKVDRADGNRTPSTLVGPRSFISPSGKLRVLFYHGYIWGLVRDLNFDLFDSSRSLLLRAEVVLTAFKECDEPTLSSGQWKSCSPSAGVKSCIPAPLFCDGVLNCGFDTHFGTDENIGNCLPSFLHSFIPPFAPSSTPPSVSHPPTQYTTTSNVPLTSSQKESSTSPTLLLNSLFNLNLPNSRSQVTPTATTMMEEKVTYATRTTPPTTTTTGTTTQPTSTTTTMSTPEELKSIPSSKSTQVMEEEPASLSTDISQQHSLFLSRPGLVNQTSILSVELKDPIVENINATEIENAEEMNESDRRLVEGDESSTTAACTVFLVLAIMGVCWMVKVCCCRKKTIIWTPEFEDEKKPNNNNNQSLQKNEYNNVNNRLPAVHNLYVKHKPNQSHCNNNNKLNIFP